MADRFRPDDPFRGPDGKFQMPDTGSYIQTHDYYESDGSYAFTEVIAERGNYKEYRITGRFIHVTQCIALLHHQLSREKLMKQARRDGEGRF
jgi:hypothetical protein